MKASPSSPRQEPPPHGTTLDGLFAPQESTRLLFLQERVFAPLHHYRGPLSNGFFSLDVASLTMHLKDNPLLLPSSLLGYLHLEAAWRESVGSLPLSPLSALLQEGGDLPFASARYGETLLESLLLRGLVEDGLRGEALEEAAQRASALLQGPRWTWKEGGTEGAHLLLLLLLWRHGGAITLALLRATALEEDTGAALSLLARMANRRLDPAYTSMPPSWWVPLAEEEAHLLSPSEEASLFMEDFGMRLHTSLMMMVLEEGDHLLEEDPSRTYDLRRAFATMRREVQERERARR